MSAIKDIAKQIKNLSVLEASELVKMLEEELGVSASAAPAMMVAGPAAGPAEEEKTEFEVSLVKYGEKKVDVMKKVREITKKDLAGAKECVEKASEASPSLIGTFSKAEADKMKAEFESIGAVVKIS